MNERRNDVRYPIGFPIKVKWQTEEGNEIVSEGTTENIGLKGVLIYLPRALPSVGSTVSLTISEPVPAEVSVDARVLRLERNAAHPQVPFMLNDPPQEWADNVWEYAGEVIASQKPEVFDDWN